MDDIPLPTDSNEAVAYFHEVERLRSSDRLRLPREPPTERLQEERLLPVGGVLQVRFDLRVIEGRKQRRVDAVVHVAVEGKMKFNTGRGVCEHGWEIELFKA